MLKHHAGRLARRLSTLFMLVAVLAAVASVPAASTNRKGPFCQREISPEGFCVEICCTGAGCMATSCG